MTQTTTTNPVQLVSSILSARFPDAPGSKISDVAAQIVDVLQVRKSEFDICSVHGSICPGGCEEESQSHLTDL